MSTRVLPFVNVHRLVVAHLKATLPTAYKVVADLPAPIEPALPLVRVLRSPGSEDEVTARPRVDLHCFAAGYDPMWELAGDVHNAMRALGGNVVGAQLIDTVRTIQDPTFLAWSDTVPRTVAVYELQLRPTP